MKEADGVDYRVERAEHGKAISVTSTLSRFREENPPSYLKEFTCTFTRSHTCIFRIAVKERRKVL